MSLLHAESAVFDPGVCHRAILKDDKLAHEVQFRIVLGDVIGHAENRTVVVVDAAAHT